MAVNLTTLFTRLGKMAHCFNTVQTARLTTVPDELQDVLDEFASASTDILATVDHLPDALANWQSSSGSLLSDLTIAAQQLIVQTVEDDNPQEDSSIETALDELIAQMEASSDSIDANAVGASYSVGGSNVGDGAFVVSTKRGDGTTEELCYAEDLVFVCESGGGSASFSVVGEEAVDLLSQQWPQGSGAATSITAIDPAVAGDNLLLNGSFEDEEDIANFADDWILVTGTVGTNIQLTNPEVQTITISGDPTSGEYRIKFTDASSRVHYSPVLAHDADGNDVQTAVRTFPKAADWEVTTTGTSPNYAHSIAMYGGPGGNVATLSSDETFDTGSITHGTTSNGGTAHRGAKSLHWICDGSVLHAVQQQLDIADLAGQQTLFSNLFAKVDNVPAAGVIRVSLWDGNAVINDDEGTANSYTFNGADLTTSWAAKNASFRLPSVLPPAVYYRIEATTAVSNGTGVFIDSAALAIGDLLYAGGPHVKAFSGATDWEAGDTATLAVTNDRGGAFQNFLHRAIGDTTRLIPSDGAGGETLSDALVG